MNQTYGIKLPKPYKKILIKLKLKYLNSHHMEYVSNEFFRNAANINNDFTNRIELRGEVTIHQLCEAKLHYK